MYKEAVVEVHGNVVFEANIAGDDGGAVSLPIDTVLPLTAVVLCDKFCHGCFDLMRQLIKPRLKGSLLSSNHVYRS